MISCSVNYYFVKHDLKGVLKCIGVKICPPHPGTDHLLSLWYVSIRFRLFGDCTRIVTHSS